jgi:putative spermidine/putrescine transport system substrate-binding protein
MGEGDPNSARAACFIALGLVALLVALGGCGSSGGGENRGGSLKEIGKPEGKLNLLSQLGYVELGWSAPFERHTGCQVINTVVETPVEMEQQMNTGRYDGVSASSTISGNLINAGVVAPVTVDLIPHYKTIFSDLKNLPFDTLDGVPYGIPSGRGANLLIWNERLVRPAPTSWNVVLDPRVASRYRGKISVSADPLYIADAALYLKVHQPDLGIGSPFQLNEEQLQAAVSLLKDQKPNVGEYWSEDTTQFSSFILGEVTVGLGSQSQYLALHGSRVPIMASPASHGFLPTEGATGSATTWMIGNAAQHPNCMYRWLDWMISPKINALVAEWLGEAPAQRKSCSLTEDAKFCAKFHAGDRRFWKRVHYREAPGARCDGASDGCVDYRDWVTAWAAVRR